MHDMETVIKQLYVNVSTSKPFHGDFFMNLGDSYRPIFGCVALVLVITAGICNAINVIVLLRLVQNLCIIFLRVRSVTINCALPFFKKELRSPVFVILAAISLSDLGTIMIFAAYVSNTYLTMIVPSPPEIPKFTNYDRALFQLIVNYIGAVTIFTSVWLHAILASWRCGVIRSVRRICFMLSLLSVTNKILFKLTARKYGQHP